MAAISTGNHPKALWPGVAAWFGAKYKEHPTEYTDLFDEATSTKNYEEEVELTNFGLAPVKGEGVAVSYTSHTQGGTKRYTHIAYALGYIVTKEERDDNLYAQVSMGRAEALARAIRQTEEIVHANVYNRGFNSSYTGIDGVELFSTAHTSLAGTWSNELAVAADLSETSLEDLLTQIGQAEDSTGNKIALMAQSLHVAVANQWEAIRILKSTLQNDTAQNAINALRAAGVLPKGVKVNHYFDDDDAWFVRTDAPRGMRRYSRVPVEFSKDNDFDTDNAKAKAYVRFVASWTDPRGAYASPGA